MLGFVFIYYLGKKFYELAFDYKKKQWPIAILGVIVYYAGIIFTGFSTGIILALTDNTAIIDEHDTLIGFLCIPFGLLAAWGLYKGLEAKWKKSVVVSVSSELIDDF